MTKSSQEGGLAKSDDGSSRKATTAEKEELVKKIVELLDNDQEEEIKGTLKPYMGELGKVMILYLWQEGADSFTGRFADGSSVS